MPAPTSNDAVVFTGLMPHAPILLAGVGRRQHHVQCRDTMQAMAEVARHAVARLPDTVVVISPHSPQRSGAFGLWRAPLLTGSFERYGGSQTPLELPLDAEFCDRLEVEAKQRAIRTWRISDEKLDHGAAVPLAYLAAAGWQSPTVVLGLTDAPAKMLVELGHAIRATAAALNRRIAVIASGDMSHRLTPAAPAGFHVDGERFDHTFLELLRARAEPPLSRLDREMLANAAQDVVEPTQVALAAADWAHADHAVLSYERPFGVGYGVAILAEPPELERSERRGPPAVCVLSHWADLPRVARDSVTGVLGVRTETPPYGAAGALAAPGAVFVTLRKAGDILRACAGSVVPGRQDLLAETWQLARRAAFADPRFPALRADELAHVRFSVSILGALEPIASPAQLDPMVHGVVARGRNGRTGVLLPHVKGVESAQEQVRIAKMKAGLGPAEPADLERFTAATFSEPPVADDD